MDTSNTYVHHTSTSVDLYIVLIDLVFLDVSDGIQFQQLLPVLAPPSDEIDTQLHLCTYEGYRRHLVSNNLLTRLLTPSAASASSAAGMRRYSCSLASIGRTAQIKLPCISRDNSRLRRSGVDGNKIIIRNKCENSNAGSLLLNRAYSKDFIFLRMT